MSSSEEVKTAFDDTFLKENIIEEGIDCMRSFMTGEIPTHIRVQRIEEKLDELSRKIDLIFADNVLVNGRFVSLNEFKKDGKK